MKPLCRFGVGKILLDELKKSSYLIVLSPYVDTYMMKLLTRLVEKRNISIVIITRRLLEPGQLSALSYVASLGSSRYVKGINRKMLILALLLVVASTLAGEYLHNMLIPMISIIVLGVFARSSIESNSILEVEYVRRGSLKIYAVDVKFHAKIYITNHRAYVATLNLTREGLLRNFECLVEVSREHALNAVKRVVQRQRYLLNILNMYENSKESNPPPNNVDTSNDNVRSGCNICSK
ncbi:MAG: hypothetical protein GXO26_04575 [Crenarchaeota archaeon]|nr:hypothetical protein [Thermoproteota archaeon]